MGGGAAAHLIRQQDLPLPSVAAGVQGVAPKKAAAHQQRGSHKRISQNDHFYHHHPRNKSEFLCGEDNNTNENKIREYSRNNYSDNINQNNNTSCTHYNHSNNKNNDYLRRIRIGWAFSGGSHLINVVTTTFLLLSLCLGHSVRGKLYNIIY